MDAMFSAYPFDGPGDYYMVVASKEEWQEVVDSLCYDIHGTHEGTGGAKLMQALKGWGIS
jgi:hypothetical protein